MGILGDALLPPVRHFWKEMLFSEKLFVVLELLRLWPSMLGIDPYRLTDPCLLLLLGNLMLFPIYMGL